MAVRDVLGDIKNKLGCRICLDVLDDARILDCGHTFCFKCIREEYERAHLTMGKCPLCRESYFLKNRDIRNVPKNFVVNDVVDTLKSADRYCRCAICQDGDGTLICLKCKLNLCNHCARRTRAKCCHELLRLHDMNSSPFLRDVIERSKSKQTCPSHPDDDVSCFCHTCKRVMCTMCHLQGHLHHDTQGLQESVRKLQAKDIPGLLGEKTREFDKTKESLSREMSFNTSRHVTIQEELLRYQSHRDECSHLHKDMCHLFEFGSEKIILELFHEREKKIDEIVKIPTQSCFRRRMVIWSAYMKCIYVIILYQWGAFMELLTPPRPRYDCAQAGNPFSTVVIGIACAISWLLEYKSPYDFFNILFPFTVILLFYR